MRCVLGVVWRVPFWIAQVWFDLAGVEWHVPIRCVALCSGKVRQVRCVRVRHDRLRSASAGTVRNGSVSCVSVRFGAAGKVGIALLCCGALRCGKEQNLRKLYRCIRRLPGYTNPPLLGTLADVEPDPDSHLFFVTTRPFDTALGREETRLLRLTAAELTRCFEEVKEDA